MKSFIRLVIIALATVLTLTGQTWLSEPQLQAQPSGSSYLPDLADLMAGTQLRHIKLAWAGDLQNWQLANYEVGEIRKELCCRSKTLPCISECPIGEAYRRGERTRVERDR